MRRRLRRDADRLDAVLTDAGLRVVGGTDLFRLAHADDADAIFLKLARAGVLCRPFAKPHLLRFGLPGRTRDWARLTEAFSKGQP
jgi:cobalamin biosynthetic protein CobC